MSPCTSVTVTFPQPIVGADLITVVRRLSNDGDTSFQMSPSYRGRHMVGQTSSFPYRHLIVTPGQEVHGIHPDETYESVQVSHHIWTDRAPGTVGYSRITVITSVEDFAKKLDKYFKLE